jgi:catechol 2,3-dioxygenase-like lactoylglutathione lyase family enzyme
MSHILALDHTSLTIPPTGEAKARGFFTGILGLPEITKPTDGNRMDGCWFDLGTQQLHLLVDEGFSASRRAHIAFCAADLGRVRQALSHAGYPVRSAQRSEGRERFFSEDPFGNRLEFISQRGSHES